MDPNVFDRLRTFHDFGLAILSAHGDAVAFMDADDPRQTTTYSEMIQQAHCISHFLQDGLMCRKQDVVAMLALNGAHHFSVHVGVSQAGCIFTGLSPTYTNFETSHQLRDSEAVVAVTDGQFLSKVLAVAPECPQLRAVLVVGAYKPPRRTRIAIVPWQSLRQYRNRPFVCRHTLNPAEDLCWLPYSSGTTGLPKGVMHTHAGFLLHYRAQFQFFAQHVVPFLTVAPSEYAIHYLPFYHAMGLLGLINSLVRGQKIVNMTRFNFAQLLQLIETYRPSGLTGVPSIMHRLLKDAAVSRHDLSSLSILGSGGSKLDPESANELRQRFPHVKSVSQGYGMTEAVTGIVMSTLRPDQPVDSCGLPLPGVQLRIVDPETEKECAANQVGELRAKIPHLMKGYWKNEAATRACFDAHGYFRTGDLAVQTEAGFVIIKDRLKELIKVKGFQVAPAEIEAVLIAHPEVKDVAVVGVPEMAHGEIPRAFVVTENARLTAAELCAYVAERLSHYKHLKGGVCFVAEIPRTASGKIQRRLLREQSQSSRADQRSKL